MGATTLPPGEGSTITIDYTVREIEGIQLFKYTVKSNDPVEPEKNLFFKVECVLN